MGHNITEPKGNIKRHCWGMQVCFYPAQELPTAHEDPTGADSDTAADPVLYTGSLDAIKEPGFPGLRLTALEAPGHEIGDSRWRSMGSPGAEANAIERVLRCLDFVLPKDFGDDEEDNDNEEDDNEEDNGAGGAEGEGGEEGNDAEEGEGEGDGAAGAE